MYPISYSMLGHILGEETVVIDEAIAQRSFARFAPCEWETQFSQRCCYIADVSVAYIRAKANPMCVFVAPKSQFGALPCPANLVLVSGCDSAEELYRLFSARVNPYLSWIERIESRMLRGCTLQDLFDISAERLGNWAALVDSAFSLLAYTKDTAIDDPLYRELMETGHYSEQAISILKFGGDRQGAAHTPRARPIVHHESLKYATVMREYMVRGETHAHLIMAENVAKESALHRDVFELLSDFIYDYFNLHGYGSSGARKPKDSLLNALASGEQIDLMSCVMQAQELGIPRGSSFVAGQVFMENAAQTALSSCAMFMEQTLLRCLSCVRGGQILLLCYGEKDAVKRNLPETEKLVASYLRERGAVLFWSAPCDSFHDLPFAFAQARELDRLKPEWADAGAQGGAPSRVDAIMHFEQDFLSWLFHATAVDERFKQYCIEQRFSSILYKEDEESYQFIRHYLLCERSASRTGKELFINRTTVLYRVKAIEKTYGVSLEDADERFEFLLLDRLRRERALGIPDQRVLL